LTRHTGHFTGTAITFLSKIRKEDFNQPRALWEKVFNGKAKERFVKNVSVHMKTCRKEEIIKRQIAIFREVSEDLASRLEKATSIKGYDGIANIRFNGTHNGMGPREHRTANGMKNMLSVPDNNGTPVKGSHTNVNHKATNGANGHTNGHANGNGIPAR
jgi:catalase